MNQKTIEKNIDKAVKVFRECLEATYLKKKKPFYAIGYHTIMNFFSGKVSQTRKKDGSLRISGDIPKMAIKDNVKGLPRSIDDWKICPVVFTFFNEDVGTDVDEK